MSLAQGSGDRAIDQAQRAVREQVTSREGGRNPTVLLTPMPRPISYGIREFVYVAQAAFSHSNDSRYASSRNNDGESRNFS